MMAMATRDVQTAPQCIASDATAPSAGTSAAAAAVLALATDVGTVGTAAGIEEGRGMIVACTNVRELP